MLRMHKTEKCENYDDDHGDANIVTR